VENGIGRPARLGLWAIYRPARSFGFVTAGDSLHPVSSLFQPPLHVIFVARRGFCTETPVSNNLAGKFSLLTEPVHTLPRVGSVRTG
jgi:hypothetical protein